MTQDIIVTLIALGTAGLLVARWWRRRSRPEPACASCDSNKAAKPARHTSAPEPAVKPVAFFGSRRR